MAIIPITVGTTSSDLMAQVPQVQRVGVGELFNASDEAISVHLGGAAGVTPAAALGSTVALGTKISTDAGAGDAPTAAGDGWAVAAGTSHHVLGTLEVIAGPWHDATGGGGAVVATASAIVMAVWVYRNSLWGCIGSYTLGNAAAIAANPTTVAGAISSPHLRSADRYYLQLSGITVANHVHVSAALTGGVPL